MTSFLTRMQLKILIPYRILLRLLRKIYSKVIPLYKQDETVSFEEHVYQKEVNKKKYESKKRKHHEFDDDMDAFERKRKKHMKRKNT